MFNVYDEVSREAFRDREVIDFDRPTPDEYRDDRTPAEIAAMAKANPSPVSAEDFAPRNRDGSILVLPDDHFDEVPF